MVLPWPLWKAAAQFRLAGRVSSSFAFWFSSLWSSPNGQAAVSPFHSLCFIFSPLIASILSFQTRPCDQQGWSVLLGCNRVAALLPLIPGPASSDLGMFFTIVVFSRPFHPALGPGWAFVGNGMCLETGDSKCWQTHSMCRGTMLRREDRYMWGFQLWREPWWSWRRFRLWLSPSSFLTFPFPHSFLFFSSFQWARMD